MGSYLFAIEGDVDSAKLAAMDGQDGVRSRSRGLEESGLEEIGFGLIIECQADDESAAVDRLAAALGIDEDRINILN